MVACCGGAMLAVVVLAGQPVWCCDDKLDFGLEFPRSNTIDDTIPWLSEQACWLLTVGTFSTIMCRIAYASLVLCTGFYKVGLVAVQCCGARSQKQDQ